MITVQRVAFLKKLRDIHVKINDLQHLKARIRAAVATVTPNMLQATWNEVEYRLDICRATREPIMKFTERVIYSEKTLIVSLCNGVTHKCILRYNYFILDTFHPDTV
jgi:hypothetical protein